MCFVPDHRPIFRVVPPIGHGLFARAVPAQGLWGQKTLTKEEEDWRRRREGKDGGGL
jgi:hypothetical protein